MSKLALCILICLCLGERVRTEDKTLTGDNVEVKVLGKSGKISLTINPPAESENEVSQVTVNWDELKEVDGDGNDVTDKRFNTFANQDFTYSDIENTTYSDIEAQMISFSASLAKQQTTLGNLTVVMYIFKEMGTLSLGEETHTVHPGTLKFNIVIENWTWGADSDAHMLEFVIDIKGKADDAVKKETETGEPQTFDMGANTNLVLSQKVKTSDSGDWTDMPTGYPDYTTKGNKKMFIFRFPKGDKITYDPSLESAPSSSVAIVGNTLVFLLAMVAAAICSN
ncbi:PREDICTED: skeletal aspartic acid-rich protein 2-like [Priapulus caudatus]|uniref:Skeletal aspartic acid-rich protein 2-like n=1 Tax=Priapulus caudatus TaxID=37621 RepID=A0ABM1FB33_PRICU|nr:PREDICTED: skeletal aspartic acid-rich protein 2-like [Priapulus caudatus]